MADVNRGNRPLSPHLSIYRPQLTSMTSILTRIAGNALLLAALLIASQMSDDGGSTETQVQIDPPA